MLKNPFHEEFIYALSLHPLLDQPLKPAAPEFAGGMLACNCDKEPVAKKW